MFTGQRQVFAEVYRPQGPKLIGTVNATPNTVASLIQAVDLTVPIRGFRFVFKGRVGVTVANYTSVNPESILNLISQIQITGTSRLLGSNITLFFGDLATLYHIGFLTKNRHGFIQVSGTKIGRPTIPLPTIAALTTAASPYDFIVTVDIPFAPFGAAGPVQSSFYAREEDWKDSFAFKFTFPSVPDNAANPLGTSAPTTVTAITAFNSGAGNATVDVYSLPLVLGVARTLVTPGLLSRSAQPITSVLQTTATGVEILRLQRKATPRIYLKIGVGTAYPVFTSVSDTTLTAVGMQIGTDRNVRDNLDSYAHKQEIASHYEVDPVQGYYVLDFMQSGNPDSSYPGDELGAGGIPRIVGNVTGAANGLGLVIQEQIERKPEGVLVGG